MGYDPPTFQAWVKITGLPLQAWTVPEITAILQEFSHPVQILPFGQAAGHFRDITAQVDTNNLSRIPLAYTYHEGDYSTQIEITILTSRPWQGGYFPPPANPGNACCHRGCHDRQQPRNDPIEPHQRSSSSSSNGVPSEPTIDLSAWLPRSYRIGHGNRCTGITLTLPLSETTPSSLSDGQLDTTPTPHSHNHTVGTVFATADLLGPKKLRWIFSLLTAPPMPTPSHIIITQFACLSAILCTSQNGGEDQDNSTLCIYYEFKMGRCTGKKENSSSLLSTQAFKELLQVPQHVRPIRCPRATAGPISALFGPKKQTFYAKSFSTITTQASLSQQNHQIPSLADIASEDPPSPLSNFDLSPRPKQIESASNQDNMLSIFLDTHDPSVPAKSNKTILSQPDTQNSLKQKRMNQLPTRRSRRLQERQETSHNTPKLLSAVKGKTSKLPFDLTFDQTPLESGSALQILQATGLQITDKIEKMIDEAIKQDQAAVITDQIMPSTPLHDPVPPLAIPGEELLL